MKEIRLKNKRLLPLLIYPLLAIFLFPYLWTYSDNPDTYQYLSIARKYAEGFFPVNGYWSPLISWLLIIPLKLFGHDLMVFKILQLTIGWMTLFQWQELLKKFELRKKEWIEWIVIPFIVSYALLNLTPDLFFLLITLFIVNRLFSANKNLIILAFAGAALFYCKSFGFPFFIALCIVWFLLIEKAGIQFWKTLFWFLLFTLPWVLLLSLQYKKVTIGEAASFNRSVDVAPLPERGDELPILNKGIYKPLEGSISAWENPGVFVSNEQITLFSSPVKFAQVVTRNFKTIWYYDFSHQPGIIFLLLLLLALYKRTIPRNKTFYILIALIFINYIGYAMILIHPRYVWINSWLMILLSVVIADKILLNKSNYQLFLILILIWFVKRPLKEILFTADKDIPFGWVFKGIKYPDQTMRVIYKQDLALEKISGEIKRMKPIGSFVAIKSVEFGRSTYVSALRIAYDSKNNFHGQINTVDSKTTETLKSMNIRYVLSFNKNDTLIAPVLYANPESSITLYQLY